MKPGDTVTDGQGRSWTLAESLGRGLWGTSWRAASPAGEVVVKVAHERGDFPADATIPEGLLEGCRDALLEQGRLLATGRRGLPRLEARFTTPAGRPVLVLPRYAATLGHKLATTGLAESLALLARVTAALRELGEVHGNLRPSNVLFTERGEPVLADVVTESARRWNDELSRLAPSRTDFRPPERGPVGPGWDTWALCAMAWIAASTRLDVDARDRRPEIPREGLDKVALAAVRDRALGRLQAEHANPRFLNRAAERLGALLNRGLSHEHDPSPPYRFDSLAALEPRLAEVAGLAAPSIDSVGPVLLGASATDGVFEGGTPVELTVTVGASLGIVGHEDVVCGLALHDLDEAGEPRVPLTGTRFDVKTHPSGRMRFHFTLPDVPPGRYRIRAAFAIKDSGQAPTLSEGRVEVRPPPGYVPPKEQPDAGPAPLAFPGSTRPAPTPEPLDDFPDDDLPAIPRPIAPTSPGLEPEVEDTPRPSRAPVVSIAPPQLVVDDGPLSVTPSAPPVRAAVPARAAATAADDQSPTEIDRGPLPTPLDRTRPAAEDRTLPSITPGPASLPPAGWDLPEVGLDDDEEEVTADLPDFGDARDLPGTSSRSAPDPLTRVLDLVRQDTYTSMMVAFIGFLLLLFLAAGLRACAG